MLVHDLFLNYFNYWRYLTTLIAVINYSLSEWGRLPFIDTNVFAAVRLRFGSGPCSDSSVPRGIHGDILLPTGACSQGKCAICAVTALNDLCTRKHVQRAEKAQTHIPNHWASTCLATEKSQYNFMLSEFK